MFCIVNIFNKLVLSIYIYIIFYYKIIKLIIFNIDVSYIANILCQHYQIMKYYHRE